MEQSLDYSAPLLTNHKKDSYFRRIAGEVPVRLLTKADLFRKVQKIRQQMAEMVWNLISIRIAEEQFICLVAK